MRKRIFLCLAALALTGAAKASHQLCEGFLPKNNLRIPVGSRAAGGITEEQFTAVLDKMQSIYQAEIASHGGRYVIDRNWDDPEVNAYAEEENGDWIIHMYGGLARYPGVTPDGFALVACHETGHHLGGAPKFTTGGNEWAAVEGEADYYGALKCLKRYFEKDDNETIVASMAIDPYAKTVCERDYSNRQDQLICERSAMAGASLGSVLMALGHDKPIHFDTPDRSQVNVTFEDHPKSQCRLDTYFQGGLCTARADIPMSDSDYHVGTCTDSHSDGLRPRCWFKP